MQKQFSNFYFLSLSLSLKCEIERRLFDSSYYFLKLNEHECNIPSSFIATPLGGKLDYKSQSWGRYEFRKAFIISDLR